MNDDRGIEAWAKGEVELDDLDLFYNVTIFELASPHVDEANVVEKQKDHARLGLLAGLVADMKVQNTKKLDILQSLEERLKNELRKPNDHSEYVQMFLLTRESLLEWCETYPVQNATHPAIVEFCENAKKLLNDWGKYAFDKSPTEEYGAAYAAYEKMLEPHLTYRTKLDQWFPQQI